MTNSAAGEGPSRARDYRQLSFWHDSLAGSLAPRPVLEGRVRADVAIVGGGYTGLWTAWYLRQLEPSLDIVVLEAEIAGFGASGRNGGWCSAYLSGIDHWLDDPSHREDAIRLQRLMFNTVSEIGRVVDEASIDCHYERAGALEFAVNPAQKIRLRQDLERLRRLGFGDADYRWLDGNAVERAPRVAGALAALEFPHCAAVHPARLARGLAERLEQRGVRIFELSPVTDLAGRELRTQQGRVDAGNVIVATEGYGATLPGHSRRLIPVHSMMVVTEPLEESLFERLRFTRRNCFGNLDRIVTYGQRTADRRIAFGCRGEYFYASGVRQAFAGTDPVFEQVRRALLRFFPELAETRFTHAWGGALGVSRSLRPAVRFDPEHGLGWAGGYFGNGVGASHLAGQTLADLITGRDSERVHTPWVNAPEAERSWEPEPLRWLGFRTARALMEAADRAEYGGGSRLAKTIDYLLP